MDSRIQGGRGEGGEGYPQEVSPGCSRREGAPLGNLLTHDNPLMDSRTQDNPLMHFRIQDNRVQRFGLGSGRPPRGECSGPTLSYISALRTILCRDSAWALPGPTKFPQIAEAQEPS